MELWSDERGMFFSYLRTLWLGVHKRNLYGASGWQTPRWRLYVNGKGWPTSLVPGGRDAGEWACRVASPASREMAAQFLWIPHSSGSSGLDDRSIWASGSGSSTRVLLNGGGDTKHCMDYCSSARGQVIFMWDKNFIPFPHLRYLRVPALPSLVPNLPLLTVWFIILWKQDTEANIWTRRGWEWGEGNPSQTGNSVSAVHLTCIMSVQNTAYFQNLCNSVMYITYIMYITAVKNTI